MNFEELLAKANSNAKKCSKKVREADEEIRHDQLQSLKRMAYLRKLEKEETKRKAPLKPPTPEPPKFVIPKKKKESKPQVDKSNVEKFLKRQELEKQEKLRIQQEKKNLLIKLRLEANNGKANKKISKHFGKTSLELQKHYGNNASHEIFLQKQKEKEEEEHKKLSDLYRKGVYKALKKKDDLLGTCKLNSEANFKFENLTMTKNSKHSNLLSKTAQLKKLELKQKTCGETTDFFSLMQKAKQNCNVDIDQVEFDYQKPPEKKLKFNSNDLSKNHFESVLDKQRLKNEKKKLSEEDRYGQKLHNNKLNMNTSLSKLSKPLKNNSERSNLKLTPTNTLLKQKKLANVDSEENFKPEKRYLPNDLRYKNSQPSSSFQNISQIQKEKRYLPGDIRYNPNTDKSFKYAGSNQNTQNLTNISKNTLMSSSKNFSNSSKFSKNILKKDKDINDIQSALVEFEQRKRELKFLEEQIERKKMLDKQIKNKEHIRKLKIEQKKKMEMNEKLKHENRYQNRNKMGRSYLNYSETDEDDEDDDKMEDEEYDSDLADFIDDTAVDDLQREDLEESLRVINPRYDKKKWKLRESMIDERKMDSKFHEVELEERKSAKIGLYEDYIEACRGSKAIS